MRVKLTKRKLLDLQQVRLITELGESAGPGFVARLYAIFGGDARAALERMRALAQSGESALLASEAHRMKGSGSSVGAAGFSRGCLEIERRARRRGIEGIEGPIDEAQRLLDATLAALSPEA